MEWNELRASDEGTRDLTQISPEQLRLYRSAFIRGADALANRLRAQNPLVDEDYLLGELSAAEVGNVLYGRCGEELDRRERKNDPPF